MIRGAPVADPRLAQRQPGTLTAQDATWRREGVGVATRLTAEGSFNIEIAAEHQLKTLQNAHAMARCGRAGRSSWSRIREERAGGSPAELTVRAPRG